MSRAALARRFTDLVGEPPMAFLTGWRLALAADLLREPDATLGAVARQVGYGSAVRAQHRVQAASRHQPARVPGPDPGRLDKAGGRRLAASRVITLTDAAAEPWIDIRCEVGCCRDQPARSA